MCWALERACAVHGMPSPTEPFEFCGNKERRRFVVLRRMQGLLVRHPRTFGSQRLKRLVDAADEGGKELLLIPVSFYWGRSPEKERSFRPNCCSPRTGSRSAVPASSSRRSCTAVIRCCASVMHCRCVRS